MNSLRIMNLSKIIHSLYRKYRFLSIVLSVNLILLFLEPETGQQSLSFTAKNFISFLFMLTPVFVCIGLLDEWVDRDTMIKIMGEKSGIKGILIAFFFGIITAVPFYALLPIAAVLIKKRSRLSNVLIFICSSASIRIPLLLFEVSSMGFQFMLVRLILNICVVFIISFLIDMLLNNKDKDEIYHNAAKL